MGRSRDMARTKGRDSKRRCDSSSANHNPDWRSITDEKKKYAAYLCSREWSVRREAVRKRCDGRCERCKILPMQAVHHLSYANKYDEPLEDLQAICQACHDFTHSKSDFDPIANKRFIRWLTIGWKKDIPWYGPGWRQEFPKGAFEYPSIAVAFQAWVSFRFCDLGQQSAFREEFWKDPNGEFVTEDGYFCPTQAELLFHQSCGSAERSFMSWLSWNCPTEHPEGNREAFNKCLECAEKLLEAKGKA